FFSSRRRHTRSKRDWSSDVCSSDLLTFKLMKELPLAYRESLRLLRLLVPNFAILGIHHEDRPTPGKRCVLRRGERGAADRLEIRSEERRVGKEWRDRRWADQNERNS